MNDWVSVPFGDSMKHLLVHNTDSAQLFTLFSSCGHRSSLCVPPVLGYVTSGAARPPGTALHSVAHFASSNPCVITVHSHQTRRQAQGMVRNCARRQQTTDAVAFAHHSCIGRTKRVCTRKRVIFNPTRIVLQYKSIPNTHTPHIHSFDNVWIETYLTGQMINL